jgi:hypothetical protein
VSLEAEILQCGEDSYKGFPVTSGRWMLFRCEVPHAEATTTMNTAATAVSAAGM